MFVSLSRHEAMIKEYERKIAELNKIIALNDASKLMNEIRMLKDEVSQKNKFMARIQDGEIVHLLDILDDDVRNFVSKDSDSMYMNFWYISQLLSAYFYNHSHEEIEHDYGRYFADTHWTHGSLSVYRDVIDDNGAKKTVLVKSFDGPKGKKE
jgi:hypothetical protein